MDTEIEQLLPTTPHINFNKTMKKRVQRKAFDDTFISGYSVSTGTDAIQPLMRASCKAYG